jgi:hypothetical protein
MPPTLSPATQDWHRRVTEDRRQADIQATCERTHAALDEAMRRADERAAMEDPRR